MQPTRHSSLSLKFLFILLFFLVFAQCTTQEIIDNGANGDADAPSISLIAPGQNAKVTGEVLLKALAWDNVAVVRVEFYVNDNLLGEDQIAPYEYIWDNAGLTGNFVLSAKAYDKAGNNAQSQDVAVTVPTPVVVILDSPFSNSVVSGQVTVSASLSGADVSKISFYIDDTLIGEDTDSPYSVSWDTLGSSDGSHSLKAVAQAVSGESYVSQGVSIQVKNDTGAPLVNLVSPQSGETVQGTVILKAAASTPASGKSVARVEFYQNGQLLGTDFSAPFEYSWNTSQVDNGSYSLMVKAYDNGNPVKSAVDNDTTVLVSNTVSSGISITEPLSGTLSGSVAVKAETQGEISKVLFYLNGTGIGTDLQAPFEILFDTTTVANQTYALQALGYNSAGVLVAESSLVNITISNEIVDTQAPVITLTSPTGNGPFSGTISVTGNATDNAGLKKAELLVNGVLRESKVLTGLSSSISFDLETSVSGTQSAFGYAPSAAGTTKEITNFGSNPGAIKMYLHTPASVSGAAPLVVALHGCTQTAVTPNAGYEYLSGWSELADRHGFYVIYPEQNNNNNGNSCFNWGGDAGTELSDMDPAGTIRVGSTYTWKGQSKTSQGDESGSIMQMVDYVKNNYQIDNSKVYVSGLSAGGYMTTLLLSVYPDVFAAGAPMSGGPYLCNRLATGKFDSQAAYNCLAPGNDQTPEHWASMINYSGYVKPAHIPWPRVQIWQGGKFDTDNYHAHSNNGDPIVKSINAVELMEQWTALHGIDQAFDERSNLKNNAKFEYRKFKDQNGRSLVEMILIEGMGHGIAVDPNGTGEDKGGNLGAWSNSVGIWSSYYAWEFFSRQENIDQKPFVRIDSPAQGASNLDGMVQISASAGDDKGIVKVEFYVDGTLKSSDTAVAYQYDWNASLASDGVHTLKAVAYDTAGQTAEHQISVYVRKGAVEPLGPGEHTIEIRVLDTSDNAAQKTVVINVGNAFTCRSWKAKNTEHVAAGRAVEKTVNYNKYAYTVGKDESLGLLGDQYYSLSTDVKETSLGYFEKGTCN